MRLGAVVLNYGTPATTISAVRSIQAYASPGQVIVVDNASRDDSVERLRAELQNVTVVVSPNNLGFSAGYNLGIREAVGRGAERVLMLNSDAVLTGDTIDLLDAALTGDVAIAGPLIVGMGTSGRIESAGVNYAVSTGRMYHRLHGISSSNVVVPDLAEVDAVSGCAVLVRREVFETVGLLAEEFFYGFEDIEFCLRARGAGFRTVCIGRAVVEHQGAASIGPSSPRRLYFAARNHLLLASRFGPQAWPIRVARAVNIVGLNVAHALVRSGTPIAPGLTAIGRGVRDHLKGRYGSDVSES